jgi:hypothetical protein
MILESNVSIIIEHSNDGTPTNGTVIKKENDIPATASAAEEMESKEAGPSSPKLSRRVTGFFTKKKKQSKDKTEESTAQENVADSTNAGTSAITNGKDEATNKETSITAAVAATSIATGVSNETRTDTATTVA